MPNYIEMYKELLPELQEKDLKEQKRLFEATLRVGEHPITRIIYNMICEKLETI